MSKRFLGFVIAHKETGDLLRTGGKVPGENHKTAKLYVSEHTARAALAKAKGVENTGEFEIVTVLRGKVQ